MKNKDLRRFFENNPLADETRQFVRYDNDGKLFLKDLKDAGLEVVDINGKTELRARGETLSTIDNPIRSANLIDPRFVAQSGAYYKHIGPTGQLFAISLSLTNMLPWEGNAQFAPSVGSTSLRFICPECYDYPDSITVTNASYTWTDGAVVLSNVVGNVGITIIGEQVGPGPTPGGLTPFSVGDKVSQIKVNTGLSDNEMQSLIESLSDTSLITLGLEGNTIEFMLPKYEIESDVEDPDQLWIMRLFENNDQSAIYYYETGDSSRKGWQDSYDNVQDTAWDKDTGIITLPMELEIVSANATANGTLFGKVESVGGLTPFADGQTISGIVIDPNGISDAQMLSALSSITDYDEDGYYDEFVEAEAIEEGKEIFLPFFAEVSNSVYNLYIEARIGSSEGEKVDVEWWSEAHDSYPAGWSVNEEPLTSEITLYLNEGQVTIKQDGISQWFNPFNGTVLGAVVGGN